MNKKVKKILFYLVITVLFLIGCSSTSDQNKDAYETYSNAIENYLLNTNRTIHIKIHQETIEDNMPGSPIDATIDVKFINEAALATKVEVNDRIYLDEVLNQETSRVYIDNICYQHQIEDGSKMQYQVTDVQLQNYANMGIIKFPQAAIKQQSIVSSNGRIEIAFTLDGAIMQNEMFTAVANSTTKMKDAAYSIVVNSDGLIQSTSYTYEYTMKENNSTVINKFNYSMAVQQYGGTVIEIPNPSEYEDISSIVKNQ